MTDGAFSRPVMLGEIPVSGLSLTLAPDQAARDRIAAELDLAAVEALEGSARLEPWFDGVRLTCRWSARIVQTCGVSLEDFPTNLAGSFEVVAVPPTSRHAPKPEEDLALDPDAPDPPDVLTSDAIDVGAYLVEHLALEIDPFPRKPGVEFRLPDQPPEPSPFAALKDWKPKG